MEVFKSQSKRFKDNFVNQLFQLVTFLTDLSTVVGKIVVGVILIFGAAATSFIIITQGIKIGSIVFIAILGTPVVVLSVLRPVVGLYVGISLSYFLFLIKRVLHSYDMPLGVAVNLCFYLAFFGVILRYLRYKDTDWSKFWTPVTVAVISLVLYNLLMAFNPNAMSVSDWTQLTLRGIVSMACLLVICHHVFSSLKGIINFTKFWLLLSLFAACYGLYQEYAGLPSWDLAWVNSSEQLHGLNFIQGRYRKWGILSDVSEFGLSMAFAAIFTVVLMLGKFSPNKKLAFGVYAIIAVLAMVYSGTRTAYVTLLIGFVIYGLVTLNNRTTLIFAMLAILGFLFILFGPVNNPSISRFRTAFKPNEDPSMLVRENNRARVQPYIYSHPIGGGVGTVGAFSKKYEGFHPLAGFPPDSGYMATVLEKGWIGLILQLLVYFSIVSFGIYNFYKAKTPIVKILYAAYTSSFFAMSVAHFSQVAIGKTPSGYVIVATYMILSRLKDFDQRNE